jgi:methylmalonyl-CoA mutase N-terminal domain/subunit
LALPSEESAQLSLRTQQILAYESGTADVVDPLGGSYYIEHLTNELEAQASEYIGRIDSLGGAVSAIEQGFQMREIGEAAYRHRQEVETGDRTIVGVNRFVTEEPPIEGLMRVDEEAARSQVERLEHLRRERDNGQVRSALGRLDEAARSDANAVPAILECVESYCTLGEVSEVLRNVFGEQKEMAAF